METDLKIERLKAEKRWDNFVFCVITCSLKRLQGPVVQNPD